jgi:hypothetical protein
MSSALAFGWRSPFISLRQTPKSQRLKLVAYWHVKTPLCVTFLLANKLPADCDWVVSRSEIKGEARA